MNREVQRRQIEMGKLEQEERGLQTQLAKVSALAESAEECNRVMAGIRQQKAEHAYCKHRFLTGMHHSNEQHQCSVVLLPAAPWFPKGC